MVTPHEIATWATWLRAAGRPETTINLRTYHIARVMREVQTDPWSLTTEQLVTYLGSRNWSPETRRSYRSSLRQFYAWALATGRRSDDPAALIPTVKLPRGLPRPTPEPVYRSALAIATPDQRLMVYLAGMCGLRRGEIARAHRRDVVPDLDGHSLRTLGKGGHERMVPLPADLAELLLARPDGWIFPSTAPGREGQHLQPETVGRKVSSLMPVGWTCHTLRHRCATIAYRSTLDLRAVQELLGHAKPETTARYTQVPVTAIRAAVDAAAADAA